jgi:hypothetical protein
MFFEDATDLDSALYTSMLDTDTTIPAPNSTSTSSATSVPNSTSDGGGDAVSAMSTREFIHLNTRDMHHKKRLRERRTPHHQHHHQQPPVPFSHTPGTSSSTSLLEHAQFRPPDVMRRIECMRASTPDLHTLPSEGKGLATVSSSPRSQYIVGCLSQQLNPRASLIIRKDLTQSFELAGMGMGDAMAREFAGSLRTIPAVCCINVEDNNLTDKGVSSLTLPLTH